MKSLANQKIFEDFIHAIKTNGKQLCDGREARCSVELIEAIYKSSREGRVIDF